MNYTLQNEKFANEVLSITAESWYLSEGMLALMKALYSFLYTENFCVVAERSFFFSLNPLLVLCCWPSYGRPYSGRPSFGWPHSLLYPSFGWLLADNILSHSTFSLWFHLRLWFVISQTKFVHPDLGFWRFDYGFSPSILVWSCLIFCLSD